MSTPTPSPSRNRFQPHCEDLPERIVPDAASDYNAGFVAYTSVYQAQVQAYQDAFVAKVNSINQQFAAQTDVLNLARQGLIDQQNAAASQVNALKAAALTNASSQLQDLQTNLNNQKAEAIQQDQDVRNALTNNPPPGLTPAQIVGGIQAVDLAAAARVNAATQAYNSAVPAILSQYNKIAQFGDAALAQVVKNVQAQYAALQKANFLVQDAVNQGYADAAKSYTAGFAAAQAQLQEGLKALQAQLAAELLAQGIGTPVTPTFSTPSYFDYYSPTSSSSSSTSSYSSSAPSQSITYDESAPKR